MSDAFIEQLTVGTVIANLERPVASIDLQCPACSASTNHERIALTQSKQPLLTGITETVLVEEGGIDLTIQRTQQMDSVHVEVTVIRATNLPRHKNLLGKERHFYMTVNDGTRTERTKATRSKGQVVTWNQILDAFHSVVLQSSLKLSLYAAHHMSNDVLIGSLDILIASKIETSFTLVQNDSSPNVSVFLTMAVRDPIRVTREALENAEQAAAGMEVLLDEWKGTIKNVEWVINVVGELGQIHPYAQMATSALTAIPELLIAQLGNDDNIRALLQAMRNSFELTQAEDLLTSIKPNSNQAFVLKTMLSHIETCSKIIQGYGNDKGFIKRLAKNLTGGKVEEIQDLCNSLASLRQNLLDDSAIATQVIVTRIQKIVEMLPKQTTDLDAKMNDLPYKSGWRASATVDRNGCLPGTRVEFLQHIINWFDDPSSKPALALFGQAGTGKSTIAHEIALRFRLEDRLGSYFSFSGNEKSKKEDHHIFTTIIHDLANRYPSFKSALGELITDNKPLRMADDYDTLFNTLLLKPLMEVDTNIHVLIIIDALDESANAVGKKGLAAFLAQSLARLPSHLRVLITSRLDGNIKESFENTEKSPFEVVEMNDPALAKTKDDIRFYFQDPQNLSSDLFREYGDALVQKSEGLFQWAAVACGHIKEPPSGWTERDCLRGLLNRNTGDKEYAHELNRPLYELYDSVLAGHFDTDLAQQRFRSVIGHLLAAVEPISVKSLILLRQFAPTLDQAGAVPAIVKHLGSLLSNVTSNNHDLSIVPLHTSFRDFLTDNLGKDGVFSVDLQTAHNELTHACLGVMLRELKFNICELESSYLANRDVPDLQARISKNIHPALSYACRFWGNHLEHLALDDALLDKLQRLFEEKFLFWLEVLSVTSSVPSAVQAFSILTTWLQSDMNEEICNSNKRKIFEELVMQAHKFQRCFAMPIAESAPHTYISALPFTPTSSKILQIYSRAFPNIVAFECGQQVTWPALEMVIATSQSEFNPAKHVAFSPDGEYIASALHKGTVCLWNATTGQMKGKPFTGPIKAVTVTSVAFSPDGKQLASGSADKTICLWNLLTAELEGEPFTGHTAAVLSVAFSPDGNCIASASADTTICLWDVTTGKLVRDPFTGHTATVNSVVFFPDGNKIISGSVDHTVRVWNTYTGRLEHGPLTGHTGVVVSVDVSPDGKWIVSGGHDRTICVWDISTAMLARDPFTGHKDRIQSVAFSPDGNKIVTTEDSTIHIYNAFTGEMEKGPLIGHANIVASAVFSPDGKRIASCSVDETIRVWDVMTEELEHRPLTGNISTITSASLSQDGTMIVSGYMDRTIRLWNALTGELVRGSFTGYTSLVMAIAFAPDGKSIASGSTDRQTICLWNTSTGALAEQGLLTGHTGGVNSVAFSSNGSWIASGSADKTIGLWEMSAEEMEPRILSGHSDAVDTVAFSPDGNRIASGSSDKTIRLWNTSTGELERDPFTAHTDGVNSVVFSPDGRWLASGSTDKTVYLWNVESGEIERGPLMGHTGEVSSVAFSPDGNWIVSGSDDNTIRVWNASTGEVKHVMSPGHTYAVTSVRFTPDGTQIISTGFDHTIRVMPAHPTSVVPDNEISFNDRSVIDDDGWIHGDEGQLLLWIPSSHRLSLYHPNIPTRIIGDNSKTRLDMSKFVHGLNWASCYQG